MVRVTRRIFSNAASTVQPPPLGFLVLLFFCSCPCYQRSPFLAAVESFTVVVAPITTAVKTQNGFRRCYRSNFKLKGWVQESYDDDEEVDDDDDDDDNFFSEERFEPVQLEDDREVPLRAQDLNFFTVNQLKQQLRLRGLKVSGRKEELIQRLVQFTGGATFAAASVMEDGDGDEIDGQERGEDEFIDVSAYLDPEDVGKDIKSTPIGSSASAVKPEDEEEQGSSEPEVWGVDARIVDDYEGRRVVIDSLSQTVVEFTGSNQSTVQAFVVANRDALKPFLAGGSSQNQTVAEERLRLIQTQREQAARRPIRFEDEQGIDEGDETGIFKNVLDRDFSDWGKYTLTGAQLSASEVQGLLLLSDVYGPFTDDTRALAEKIAFESQPVVVMVPDLFRGRPWTGPTDGVNERGQTYEQWRTTHPDLRVSVDIRAAASCLRERYGVSSVVVWGTCYGGGRALEAAAGWLPDGNIHDVDGRVGPPYVDPMAAIAWYPTRYNAKNLFGKTHQGTTEDMQGNPRQIAVMAVFAGKDVIPGAAPDDAASLKHLLEEDQRVRDHMVKVFKGQNHGFAHHGISEEPDKDYFERFVDNEFGGAGRVSIGGSDAEVAFLLSSAFFETYSRVFLPTVGAPISLDENEIEWSSNLEMRNLDETNSRDVRQEIEDAVENFVEEPLGGYRIDPTDKSQEDELVRLLRSMESPEAKNGPYAIQPDDDLPAIYGKLTAADENFELF